MKNNLLNELFQYAKQGINRNNEEEKERVKNLIRDLPNINAKFENGETLLHIACKNGNSMLANLMFAVWRERGEVYKESGNRDEFKPDSNLHQPDVGALDDDGETPLHKACRAGSYKLIIKLLLMWDTDLSTKNSQGEIPFDIALNSQDESFLQKFLEFAIKQDINFLDRLENKIGLERIEQCKDIVNEEQKVDTAIAIILGILNVGSQNSNTQELNQDEITSAGEAEEQPEG